MDDGKVISGYDGKIMRRLLGYAKPYWLLVLGALISLVIATAGDLLLPIVIRTAIDHSHVKPDAPIAGAREIAFFPPMTGG